MIIWFNRDNIRFEICTETKLSAEFLIKTHYLKHHYFQFHCNFVTFLNQIFHIFFSPCPFLLRVQSLTGGDLVRGGGHIPLHHTHYFTIFEYIHVYGFGSRIMVLSTEYVYVFITFDNVLMIFFPGLFQHQIIMRILIITTYNVIQLGFFLINKPKFKPCWLTNRIANMELRKY